MIEPNRLQIQMGLPEVFKRSAAKLYYDAFGRKLKPILGEETTGVPLIQGAIDTECCISAHADDRLLGVAGFHHHQRHLVHLKRRALIQQFGWLSGVIRYAVFVATSRLPQPQELVMDGIAVHPAARGQGVGTQLLEVLYQFAQQHGYRSIRLDVINTNPGARRLYERVGFVPQSTQPLPFLRAYGFTAVTTMTRAVQ